MKAPLNRLYINNNSFHLAPKYASIFVRKNYLFQEENSFSRALLSERFEEQIMSKDKYPNIF